MSKVSAIVSVKWLAEKVISGTKGIRILDSSWHLPSSGRLAHKEYLEKHIPGALFFDLDDCADKKSELGHMLPPPKEFESYIGNLGIDNNTHVVVYDNNENFGIFSAQRAWWTFRVFGHHTVSILNGGLPKWISQNLQVTKEIPKYPSSNFTANFSPHLVKSFKEVEENLTSMEYQLVDARSTGRFNGTAPEPRPEIKPGHIPDSVNFPFMDIMDLETKTVKSPEELKQMFDKLSIDLNKPILASCGSGVTACCVVLAASLCGKEDVAVYDGAWTEWFLKAKPEQTVNCPKD